MQDMIKMKTDNVDRAYIYQVSLQSNMLNDARVIASGYIASGSLVLDVGCACGDFGQFLHNKNGIRLHGFEYDAKSIEQAKSKNIYETLSQVDLNNFDVSHYSDLHGVFDVVAVMDVLEHTINPEAILEKLKIFLKPSGIFVISLPNASFGELKAKLLLDNFEYTEVGIMDKTHLRFYTFNTIADLFSNVSLRIGQCHATVGLIDEHLSNLPYSVKRYIRKNPRSYIFQYVFIAVPTLNNDFDTFSENIRAVDLDWDAINKPLRTMMGNRVVHFFLPLKSRRRSFVKKLFYILRKDRRVG